MALRSKNPNVLELYVLRTKHKKHLSKKPTSSGSSLPLLPLEDETLISSLSTVQRIASQPSFEARDEKSRFSESTAAHPVSQADHLASIWQPTPAEQSSLARALSPFVLAPESSQSKPKPSQGASSLSWSSLARAAVVGPTQEPSQRRINGHPPPFQVYHDPENVYLPTVSLLSSSNGTVVGLKDAWHASLSGPLLPSKKEHEVTTQSRCQNEEEDDDTEEDDDDLVDCAHDKKLTDDMFRLLFGEKVDGTKIAVSENSIVDDSSEVIAGPPEPRRLLFEAIDEDFNVYDTPSTVLSETPLTPSEQFLSEMWASIQDKFNKEDVIPSSKGTMSRPDYANLIADYVAHRDDADSTTRAEYVLLYMLKMNLAGSSKVRPDGGCYNKVIHGYAEACQPYNAEAIMNLMCAMYDEGDEMAQPNTRHYTSLMYAWQRSHHVDAPEHCEQILRKMHELHELGVLPNCKPDAYTYTTVLHCWSNSSRADAPQRAEELFRAMKQRCERGDEGLAPDCVAYSNLINSIVNGQGYSRAADILWEMVDDFLKGNSKCKPRIRNLNTILAVWSKSSAPYAAERAEEIVHRWLKLNKTTEMDIKPDGYTYCLLLKCWSISNRSDAPQRAEDTLFWLEKLGKEGDKAARLNTMKYTTVLMAWINRNKWKSASILFDKMAQDFFKGNKDAKPDYSTYQKIVQGLCNSSMVSDADNLVRTMLSLPFRDGDSDLWSCAPVIKAWGHAGCPERSEQLVKHLQFLYKHEGIKVGPTKHLYRLVIAAWDKSKAHDRNGRIRALEWHMTKLFDHAGNQTRSKGIKKQIHF